MSTLKSHEKVVFERLFDRGGYVLNFTDNTFREFFNEYRITIDDAKYHKNGTSKMKRLRAFWEIEPDNIVGGVLEGLLQYAINTVEVNTNDEEIARKIISRLAGKEFKITDSVKDEEEFLQREFREFNIEKLMLDEKFGDVIKQRIVEIQKGIKSGLPLAVIFLCGSTLEGLLLDAASKNSQLYNSATTSPKDKNGKVKPIYEWSLESLINVAHELNHISLDVKKYSHVLRDFRNYIHPRQQATQGFNPDIHTAKISWQVLQAAIANLTGDRK